MLLEGDDFVGELLQAHLVSELLQRDRSGADVAQPVERIETEAPALFREGIAHVDQAVAAARAEVLQQLPIDGSLHEVKDDVVGQLGGINKLAVALEASRVHQAHEKGQADRIRRSRCS